MILFVLGLILLNRSGAVRGLSVGHDGIYTMKATGVGWINWNPSRLKGIVERN